MSVAIGSQTRKEAAAGAAMVRAGMGTGRARNRMQAARGRSSPGLRMPRQRRG
jgi:predicted butyrate kinase (DUF1464 family)